MTIALRDLNALDPDVVSQDLALTAASVQEQNPTLDVRRGVLHDLLLYPHAVLAAQLQANLTDYLNARSLLAIEADPALADPALVDDVLSNFGLTRQPGGSAVGQVTIVVSADVTLTLVAGFVFQANGLNFATDQVYTAKAEASQVVVSGDRLLLSTFDGNWLFTVPVVAVAEGVAGNLGKDTLMVPPVAPANYVTSYAAVSFQGGLAAEGNAELLSRLQQGIACKAPSNRVNLMAMLRQVDAFSRVTAASILGYGDAEMLRDKHGIFPVGCGGRIDWYVRTQERLLHQALTRTATCVAVDPAANTSTWQLAVSRDEAPGFYELTSVRRAGNTSAAGGFPIGMEARALDFADDGWHPDVVDLVEGDYSRYVTAVIRFVDDDPDQGGIAVGSTAGYQLDAVGLPLLAAIQDTVSTPDIRSRTADLLIRAPVPGFLKVNLTVTKRAGQADPDVTALTEALAQAVNTVGFTGVLYASQLYCVVVPFLPEGQRVSGADMSLRLRYPGGGTRYLRSSTVLEVPADPGRLVSARTVQFFLEPADVGITVVTALAVDV